MEIMCIIVEAFEIETGSTTSDDIHVYIEEVNPDDIDYRSVLDVALYKAKITVDDLYSIQNDKAAIVEYFEKSNLKLLIKFVEMGF